MNHKYRFSNENERNSFNNLYEHICMNILNDVHNLPQSFYWKIRNLKKEEALSSFAKMNNCNVYDLVLLELLTNDRYIKDVLYSKDFKNDYLKLSYALAIVTNKIKVKNNAYLKKMNDEINKKAKEAEAIKNIAITHEDMTSKLSYKKKTQDLASFKDKYWE